MSIKGLSDRGMSFPEIGQIRKGAKVTKTRKDGSTYETPVDLSYFRVVFDEREIRAAEIFTELYGPEPTMIRIMLPFHEIWRMWDPFLEAYTAGRMVARADGENFIHLIDTKTGETLVRNGIDVKTNKPRPYFEGQSVGSYIDGKGQEQQVYCKPNGRLMVIIPEFARMVYMTVITTSIHDILNISDQLRAYAVLNDNQLAGIPLILRRRPRSISTPDKDGKRVRRVKWLLSLEADPEWVKKRLLETKRLALPGNGLPLSLPSGELPDDEPPPEGLETDHDEDEVEEGNFSIPGELPPPEEPPDAITEQAAKPAAEKKSAPANTKKEKPANDLNGKGRPYAPDVLRAKLVEFGKQYTGKPTEPQISLIAMLIEKAFAGRSDSSDLRHDVQFYLFGHKSLKEADPLTLLAALNNWLKPAQDQGGDYHPDGMAVQEIVRVQTEALVAEG
ncbi:MAG: hypothetical protein A2V45_08180 [Candidatus Aminicenantes bacterium RBG_19FT_COMBO_58_17]|nr:MAG: hypothetical protein A2V45_08180 [Candidatus Aminicenantes bacterium RBG_19FT_COMBO_58_17]